jgi:rod shape-determining protein MreD
VRPRRTAIGAALVLTSLLLQVAVLPVVAGGGFVPDLLIVLVAVVSLEQRSRTGLWLAGSAGLLADLTSVTVPLGSSILVYASLAYLLGLLRPYVAERADLTTSLLTGLAGVLSVLGHAALAGLLSTQNPPDAQLILWAALLVGAFAVLLAPLVLVIVRRTLGAVDSLAESVG